MAVSPYGQNTAYQNVENEYNRMRPRTGAGGAPQASEQASEVPTNAGAQTRARRAPAPAQTPAMGTTQSAPTFAQLQQQGQARPAPPAPAPAPQQMAQQEQALVNMRSGFVAPGDQQTAGAPTGMGTEQQALQAVINAQNGVAGGNMLSASQMSPAQYEAGRAQWLAGGGNDTGINPGFSVQQMLQQQQQGVPLSPQYQQFQQQLASQSAAPGAPTAPQALASTASAPAAAAPGSAAGSSSSFSGQNPNSPINAQLQQYAQQMLQTPSAYNDAAMQAQFGRMAGQIDDEYAQRETGVREEMARRGLADSSIAGGRLADLNIGRRSAKTELGAQIAEQAAQRYGTDRAAALQAALGVNAQDIQQSQFGAQMGLENARMAMQGDQFNRNLSQQDNQFTRNLLQQGSQFDRTFGQNQYQFDANLANNMNQFNRSFGLQQDQFNAQNRQWDTNFRENTRRYDQDFANGNSQFDRTLENNKNQFNQNLSQQGLQWLMQFLGPNFASYGY